MGPQSARGVGPYTCVRNWGSELWVCVTFWKTHSLYCKKKYQNSDGQ